MLRLVAGLTAGAAPIGPVASRLNEPGGKIAEGGNPDLPSAAVPKGASVRATAVAELQSRGWSPVSYEREIGGSVTRCDCLSATAVVSLILSEVEDDLLRWSGVVGHSRTVV